MPLERNDFVTACVAGVELTLFGPVDQADAPVVFVFGGRGGAATRQYGWCRELAALGLIAIAIDHRNHGRRIVDQTCNDGWWRPHHPADMYGVMLGSALDISLLLDLMPARLGLKCESVGVTGGSLGGHVTMLAMGLDERITVAAAQIGGGDYRRLMELRCLENGGSDESFQAYFPAELQAVVEKYDPIHRPAAFADRPLLMLNGREDNLVQLECNERFVEAAAGCYTHADRLQLVAVDGVGHQVTDDMRRQGNQWLATWLLADGVAGS